MSQELIYQLLCGLFLAGAVYGGIRADLRGMHERINQAVKTGDEAHKRIDAILMKGANHE